MKAIGIDEMDTIIDCDISVSPCSVMSGTLAERASASERATHVT